MAGHTNGCAVVRETRNASPAATTYLAVTYFEQGTALLRRHSFAEAESYLREVVQIWPDHAGAWNNLGTAVWQQGRVLEAEEHYRRALAKAPDDFGALNNLGNCLWEQARPCEAVVHYRRALAIQFDSAETQMNLGVVLSDLGEFDEAIRWFTSSLQLNPYSPEAYDNVGMTLARQGFLDEAMTWYERALAVRPEYPEARRNRSYIWLSRGDYERGWPEHEWRLWCRNHKILTVPRPQWTGEDIRGRTILLHAEQGLGDVLQFIRFADPVKRRGARVIAACPESLVRLVALCPSVDAVQDWYDPIPDCDVHATVMSLPAILGTTLASLPGDPYPYLAPDAVTVDRWRPIVDRSLAPAYSHDDEHTRTFRIGIAWQGNPRNRIDRWRSFPLSQFAHLAELPGVRLISLQKGQGTEQLAELGGRFPVAVLPEAGAGEDDRRDFLDTAAVMSLVDLVIAPESAVTHLAGSLGVRAWVPLPAVADWRWLLDRDDSPWYPAMTLFRQEVADDWGPVFRRMADRLRAELAG